jgi:hypothetical protein
MVKVTWTGYNSNRITVATRGSRYDNWDTALLLTVSEARELLVELRDFVKDLPGDA